MKDSKICRFFHKQGLGKALPNKYLSGVEDGAEAESGTLDDTCSNKFRITVTRNSAEIKKSGEPFLYQDSPFSCGGDNIISFFFRNTAP